MGRDKGSCSHFSAARMAFTIALACRAFMPSCGLMAADAANQFVIISDTQGIEGVDRMAREMIELEPHFAIAVGDMPSAFDAPADLFRRLREANVPLHIAMGNHDEGTRVAVRSCLPPYPFNDEIDPALRYVVEKKYSYSFNRGGVHFVIVDTCTDDDQREIEWLEADLIGHANNPRKLPALLFMHYPSWMIGKNARTDGPIHRVLAAHPDKHTVKAAFAGHTHDGKHYPPRETLDIPLYTLYPSAPFGDVRHTEYVVATVAPGAITFERKVIMDAGQGKDFIIRPISGTFTSLKK